jgi:hypothetical protein
LLLKLTSKTHYYTLYLLGFTIFNLWVTPAVLISLAHLTSFEIKLIMQETLKKADETFGPDNKDLYIAFDGLLSRHLPS